MDYIDGSPEEVVWNPTIKTAYICTTVMKLLLELFFIHNIYLLQRVTNNADRLVDENNNELPQLAFSELWIIPEKYQCYLGESPHSACGQVLKLKIFADSGKNEQN